MKKVQKPVKIIKTTGFFDDVIVSLYDDKVITDDGYYPIEKSFDEILFTDFFPVTTNAKAEYEICKFACDRLKNKTGFSNGLKRCLDFYEAYDPNAVKDFTFKSVTDVCSIKISQKLKLTAYGLEVWEFEKLKMLVKPDRLFLVGPYAKALPLNVRIELKDFMFNAMGKQNRLSINDGFPLIDYNAFETGKYLWESGDWNKGAKLSLEKGCIYYTGWSSPRDGGAQTFNMEWFLYFGTDYFKLVTNRDFVDQYEAICNVIKQHIIVH